MADVDAKREAAIKKKEEERRYVRARLPQTFCCHLLHKMASQRTVATCLTRAVSLSPAPA